MNRRKFLDIITKLIPAIPFLDKLKLTGKEVSLPKQIEITNIRLNDFSTTSVLKLLKDGEWEVVGTLEDFNFPSEVWKDSEEEKESRKIPFGGYTIKDGKIHKLEDVKEEMEEGYS